MGLNINHLSKQFGDFTAVDNLNFMSKKGICMAYLVEMAQVKRQRFV